MTETSPKMREEGKVQRNGESEPAVVIEHLVKQFGKLRAIDNLNMTINSGETFGLIGPNGSGKTTLIRMVVGLSRPTGGTIHIMKEKMPSSKVSPASGLYATTQRSLP